MDYKILEREGYSYIKSVLRLSDDKTFNIGTKTSLGKIQGFYEDILGGKVLAFISVQYNIISIYASVQNISVDLKELILVED